VPDPPPQLRPLKRPHVVRLPAAARCGFPHLCYVGTCLDIIERLSEDPAAVMSNVYLWLKFLHVGAVLAFLLTHGISGGASLLLERRRDLATRRLLLELSYTALTFSTPALLVVLLSGLALGFYGTWWGRGWIWAALAIFLVVTVGMSVFSYRFEGARKAAGLGYRGAGIKRLTPIAPDEDRLERELPKLRSRDLAVAGSVSLAILVWLMVFKPF
jgi:hypothetical protein